MFKLIHRGIEVGIITEETVNGFNLHGTVVYKDAAAPLLPMLAWYSSPASNTEEPPFPPELLYGWAVESEDGVRDTIGLPEVTQVNNENEIWWRYMDEEDDHP